MNTLIEKWKSGSIPRLGFGAMRLPEDSNNEMDFEMTNALVDAYMATDFGCIHYFDTAYGYHAGRSETTIRECVVKRYPRESFYLADKMPFWQVKAPEDMERIFNHQLEKCGVDYFDFYLLHCMENDTYATAKQHGGYAFLKALKASGKAKHIGFSFHGDAKLLTTILDDCPEVDFVQLQLNYLDCNDYGAQELYDIVTARNLPIIVMEPVRGGALAVMADEAETTFKAAAPNASIASWAIRYVASLPNVMTVLSGMSTMPQVQDNTALLKDFVPLSDAEYKVIGTVLGQLRAIPTVPCTACKYCATCPQEIPISDIFTMYNRYAGNKDLPGFRRAYGGINEANRVTQCIECGACEAVCPQSIAIPARLKEAVSAL